MTDRLIAFIDVADSLGMYRRLGDRDAQRAIAAELGGSERRVREGGGDVVKHTGDGLLAVFDCRKRGLEALGSVQRAAALGLRIGAHFGPVLARAGDVFGDTVNRAARLAALARVNEILVSEAVAGAVDSKVRDRLQPVERLRLKGVDEIECVYRYGWEERNATQVNTAISITALKIHGELRVDTADGPIRLAQGEQVVFGRDQSCDIVLDDSRVSRFHATLEWQHGRCVLRDHSTNGTFVTPLEAPSVEGRTVLLRREGMPLPVAGHVKLATLDGGPGFDFRYE